MEIKNEDLKSIYDLLSEITSPKVTYDEDVSSMKNHAINTMRISARTAMDIMENYDIEEL